MKKTNRALSVILALVMLFSSCIFVNAEGNMLAESEIPVFSDMVADGHWAKEALEFNVKAQVIKGYEDDTVRASRNMTRAEMAAIINRAFGATVETEINFDDVKPEQWFYNDIAKAYNMQSFLGTGEKTMDPNDPIRREDVFLAMSRVLVLYGGDQSVLDNYADGAEVDTWARDAMATLIEKGYVNGDNENELDPRDPITRAEFSQFIYNIFKTYYHIEGSYNKVNTVGSVMLRGQDIKLENVTVNGDLVLGDGVGVGDAHLTNVDIKGRLLCRGGEGYVYLKNVTVGEIVVVNDVNGTVNFYNYRDEPIFNGVTEYTPATYLKRAAGGGGGAVPGGGATTYYTVTFDYTAQTNAGTISASTYVSVASGSTIPADKFPTNAYDAQGRTLAGWYDSNGNQYTTETKINKNITLTPRWYDSEILALELVYSEGVSGNNSIQIPGVAVDRDTDEMVDVVKELLAKPEFATGYNHVHFGKGSYKGIFTKKVNGYSFAEHDKDVNMLEVNLVDLVGADGLKSIFTAGYRGEVIPEVDVSADYDTNAEVKKTIDYIIDTAVTSNLIKVEENNSYYNYDVAVILFRQLLEGLTWDDVKAYVPADYTANVPEAVIKTVFERTQTEIHADLKAAIDSVYFNAGSATDVSFIVNINPVADGYVHTLELIGDNANAVGSIADWATVAMMFKTDDTADTGYDYLGGAEYATALASFVTQFNSAASTAGFATDDDVVGTYFGKALTVIDLLLGTQYADEYTNKSGEVSEVFDSYEKDMTVGEFFDTVLSGSTTQELPFVTVKWTFTSTIAE